MSIESVAPFSLKHILHPSSHESRVLDSANPLLLCEFGKVLNISGGNKSTEVCEWEELLWRDLWILMLDADSSEVVLSSEDRQAQSIQQHRCMASLRRPRAYVRWEVVYIPHSAE